MRKVANVKDGRLRPQSPLGALPAQSEFGSIKLKLVFDAKLFQDRRQHLMDHAHTSEKFVHIDVWMKAAFVKAKAMRFSGLAQLVVGIEGNVPGSGVSF